MQIQPQWFGRVTKEGARVSAILCLLALFGALVGGAAAGELLAKKAGCDFYGKTAVDGVKFAGKVVAAET